MAVHNTPLHYLDAAINSVLDQSFADFEFIIVDDGSAETPSQRLREHAARDDRIHLHRLPSNVGLTRALNIGLRLAQAEYVARQDADDLSFPNRFAEEFRFLESNPDIVAVGSNAELIDQFGTRVRGSHIDKDLRGLIRRNVLIHGAMMFRRGVLDRLGGYNDRMRLSQDYELYLRMTRQYGMKLGLVDQELYSLRLHSNSLSSRKRLKQLYFSVLAKALTMPGNIRPWRRRLFFVIEFAKDLMITHKMLLPSLIRWRPR